MVIKARSLRFELSWTHGLIIAAVVACIGVARFQILSYRSVRSFDADLLGDARFLSSRLEARADGLHWSTSGLSPDDTLILEEQRAFAVITGLDGGIVQPDLQSGYMRELIEHGDLRAVLSQTDGVTETAPLGGHVYRFVSLKLTRAGLPANLVLHLGRSIESMRGVLQDYLFAYLWTVPAILLASGATAWFLSGRALRPFEEVARTAEQITSRNLHTQIVSGRQELEILRLVDAFNSMVRRLDESFRQMQRFNEDAAHELRTPLTILQGETELALRSTDLSDEIRSLLASNLEELARMTRIVNDLLTLADASAGAHILARSPIRLRPLLEDLVDQMALLAADRGIELLHEEIPDVTIEGDDLWIRRAFLNLIDNAIKYSRERGKVQVQAQDRDGMVFVAVKDNGIGIPAADLPFIFDRLYRVDPARTRESGGAGLGLALVKWIVEEHRGSIHVESEPGEWSSFVVGFPKSHGPGRIDATPN